MSGEEDAVVDEKSGHLEFFDADGRKIWEGKVDFNNIHKQVWEKMKQKIYDDAWLREQCAGIGER